MKKKLVKASLCIRSLIAASLLPCLVYGGESSNSLPTPTITKYEWEQYLKGHSCTEDILVLLDGTRLCGKLEKIPSLNFQQGSIAFNPEDVGAIAIVSRDKTLKIQYISREGQDYLGQAGGVKFVFNVHQPNENDPMHSQIKEIDPQLVKFILLRHQEGAKPLSPISVASIELRNGDHLPAILLDEPIFLTDGKHELALQPGEILELTVEGHIQGRILREGLPSDLKPMSAAQSFFRIRIPKNGQTWRLPWEQVDSIQTHNGGFKQSQGREFSFQQWLEEDQVVHSQETPESFGNNQGTLLEGARGFVALEPSAFDGLDLLGADLMHDVEPLFDPAEEQGWGLDIAFEDLHQEVWGNARDVVAMLDQEQFQAIAETLIFDDIKKVDVDPAPFDVPPLDDDKHPSGEGAEELAEADENIPHENSELTEKKEPQDIDVLFNSQRAEFTSAEKRLLESLLSDEVGEETPAEDPTRDVPHHVQNMIYLEEEEFDAAVNHSDLPLIRGVFIPTQGTPTLRFKAPSLYFDAKPVTNEDYAVFIRETGHSAPVHWQEGRAPAGQEGRPVVNVSYKDAQAYAEWAGKRLPTEIEWARAVKNGNDRLERPLAIKEWTATPASFHSKKIFTGASFQPRNENWFDHTTGFRTVTDAD